MTQLYDCPCGYSTDRARSGTCCKCGKRIPGHTQEPKLPRHIEYTHGEYQVAIDDVNGFYISDRADPEDLEKIIAHMRHLRATKGLPKDPGAPVS